MRRETKFRAKSLEGGMVYFDLHESHFSGDPDMVFYVDSIPCEVGTEQQYTGVHDRNGKEGYHKDIAQDAIGKRWQIEWIEIDATFVLLGINDEAFCGDSLAMRHLPEMVIIGNIYEEVK